MNKRKRKVRDSSPGLNKKQKTSATGDLFSTPKINDKNRIVKNVPQTGIRYEPVCYLCGASHGITTYHAAGGVLGVCVRCNGGTL